MKLKNNGFTLIEMFIVVAVLGLFMTLVYPVLSYTSKASNTMNRLDVYHDVRKVDQTISNELKLGVKVLYPPKDDVELVSDWYPQLIFRNHLNQVLMLYVNKKNKLVLFNYDAVEGSYLSLGKVLGTNIKDFEVRRHGTSVVEYKLTFEIEKKDFVITNRITLVNVF